MNPQALESQVVPIMEQFVGSSGAPNWQVKGIALGGQAGAFLVSRRDHTPVCEDYARVIVKVFSPSCGNVADAARDEFESLERLHAAINGQTFNSWRIHSPRLLFQSSKPYAAVMTHVPGQTLSSLLRQSPRLDRTLFSAIAPAVVAALDRYWSLEKRPYGDLHLRNILCDPLGNDLSFVDPGMPAASWLCPEIDRRWFPASRDLAYLLYYTASLVKLTFDKPALRRHEKWLATEILRSALQSLASPAEREELLQEIYACAFSHLARIRSSLALRGMWRLAVKKISARYMQEVFDELRASLRQGSLAPVGVGLEMRA